MEPSVPFHVSSAIRDPRNQLLKQKSVSRPSHFSRDATIAAENGETTVAPQP